MNIKTKFDIGQIVYLSTDKQQEKRMVIGFTFRQTGMMYDLGFGSTSSWHYELEISSEENILTKVQ